MILKKKSFWQGLTGVFTLSLAVSISVGQILEANKAAVDSAFGTQSTLLVSESGEGLYTAFTPNDKYVNKDASGKITSYNTKNFLKDQIQLGRRSGYEGSVLLKNKNNTLPLASQASVTLLGKRSHTPVLGSGQGVDSVGQIITFERALSGTSTDFAHDFVKPSRGDGPDYSKMDNFDFKDLNIDGRTDGAGANFKLNQAMIDRYAELLATDAYKCGYNDRPQGYQPKEVPAADISGVSLTGYKDAAIVVLSRPSSESSDYARPSEGQTCVLGLTEEEKGIINYATDNFNKVVVLINTNSPMEIQELEDNDKIGAILWVGHPGNYGFLGVADILCGRVSPSGGLADIYARYAMSTPAAVNFGSYTFTNPSGKDATADNHGITRNNSNHYVIEAEGIYTGYRYYETRYYDAVMNKGNASGSSGIYGSKNNTWNYAEEVTYPFGYGLSYTNFEFTIVDSKLEHKSHEMYTNFRVKVKNTGNVAGATPVQIYGQAPYEHTNNKNQLQKPAVQLLEFGKTKVIEPNKEEIVEVEVDWQNIASYDQNYENADGSKGSYILDKGDYLFTVANGSHEAVNNFLAKKGATGADAIGNANLVVVENYRPSSGKDVDGDTFGYSKSGKKIKNQIEYSDWNYYNSDTKVTYLSRNDWVGTYPVEYKDLTAPDSMLDDLNGKYYTLKTDQDTSEVKWGDSTITLNFFDLAKMPFDDERWTQILDKMTLQDAITMAAYGGNTFAAANSVGFSGGKLTENTGNGIQTYLPSSSLLDDKCPWKVTDTDNNHNMSLKVFGSAVLMASSFSHDMLFAMGTFIGEEAILVGLPILWGPGGNTHRSPFNGRTGEYYSEDPVLTGVGCMEFAVGARDRGLIAAPKHYAFNDQETNRNGVAPFLTEQRARETELRAFQIAFEATSYDRKRNTDTGMLGMMTSFSKIGAVECTCSVGLVNNIAVGEWNFHGYTVTDINDDFDLFDGIVMGGCTGYDNRMIGNPSWDVLTADNSRIKNSGETVNLERYAKDKDLQLALKESCHRTLYTFCQSVLMNQYNATTRIVDQLTSWRVLYITLTSVSAALTGISAVLALVLSFLKKEAN